MMQVISRKEKDRQVKRRISADEDSGSEVPFFFFESIDVLIYEIDSQIIIFFKNEEILCIGLIFVDYTEEFLYNFLPLQLHVGFFYYSVL